MDFLTTQNEQVFTILEEDHNFYLTLSASKTFASKNKAAGIIQNAWSGYKKRRTFHFIKNKLIEFTNEDPVKMLKRVNVFEAQLFEKKYGHCLVFRLAGPIFPPVIVYKVFINCQKNIDGGDEKGILKSLSKNEWGVFYVYKSSHEKSLTTKKRFKKKKSGIQWIKKVY